MKNRRCIIAIRYSRKKNFQRRHIKEEINYCNESIPFKKFLVILPDKTNKIMTKSEALAEAKKNDLDLFVVSKEKNNVVCWISDFNRYKYNRQKKIKLLNKKRKQLKVKQIRFLANIDKNDLKVKANLANSFLKNQYKVKLSLRLLGRQNFSPKYFLTLFYDLIDMLTEAKNQSLLKKSIVKVNNYFEVLAIPKK